MTYGLDSKVRVSGTYKDSNSVATDPTTPVLRVIDPNGTETTPALTKDGVGLYHADVIVTTSGTWYYRFYGDLTNAGALVAGMSDQSFVVDATRAP